MTKSFCDICGQEEMNLERLTLKVNEYGKEKHFDACGSCVKKLYKKICTVETEFVRSSKWWKEHQNKDGDINYGDFVMVGNAEQGGYKCPKCGCVNNAYVDGKTCPNCGYGKKKLK